MTLLDAMSSAEPGAIPKTPFYAEHQGELVLVRCVLTRTAVYEFGGERHLAKFAEFELLGELEWFQMPTGKDAARARRGRQMAMRLKRRETSGV